MWRTFVLSESAPWMRCLWCGDRGHFRESCAREHAHGAIARDGLCLGCEAA